MTDVAVPEKIVSMTSTIAAAFLRNNTVSPTEIPDLIGAVSATLRGLAAPAPFALTPVPAVSIKASITPDFMICLEDGLKFKSLKRHLRDKFDLTPDAYRAKWGLPGDYPMVAPNYAAARSKIAKQFNLGANGRGKPTVSTDVVETVEGIVSVVGDNLVTETNSVIVVETPTGEVITLDTVAVTSDLDTIRADVKNGNFQATIGTDGLLCLEDGKVVKDLGRHARKHFNLSADAYRAKWGLPTNYPMTFKS